MSDLRFWDNFSIGFIKGHAVSLCIVAVVGPTWVGVRFGWGMGLASVAISLVALRFAVWMWSYARAWDRRINQVGESE